MTIFLRPDVWQAALLAFLVAAVATPLVRAGARRIGMVAAPKSDRWHRRPTALLGGVAIYVAVVSVTVWQFSYPVFHRYIFPASTLLFLIGIVDDIINLKPYQKLVGQIVGASIVVYAGLVLPWTSSLALNSAITVFWLIGITNAMNMLDNMDGLAGGIAAIASIFLALNFFSLGQTVEGTVAIILAGALCGFLLFNSQPASIFMGDCGSMFIGFFLASTALLTTTSGRTRSFLPILAVPVLTLVIPIFDTTLVTLWRKLAGRSASQGGRDHTSHRLVALGLSERRAVWLLYTLATAAGFLALKVRDWSLHESVVAILGFTVVLTLIGVYLSGVKVYPPNAELPHRPIVSFLIDLSYKRRIFEALLDVTLIGLAYYGAWTLRFGRLAPDDPYFSMMIRTLPIVIGMKMAVFLFSGVYRGLWRYIGVHDVARIVKSVTLASIVVTVALLFVFRQYTISRGVMLLDLLLLAVLMVGSRVAFRVARRLLPTRRPAVGRPVLIYGAGDAGELLLRELFNNDSLGYDAVAFLDDDPKKLGKVIHGRRVYSGDSLRAVAESLGAQEVLISTAKLPERRREEIIEECNAAAIPLREMRIQLVTISSWERDPLADETEMARTAAPILHVRSHGSTHLVDDELIVRADARSHS
jgi:UDP-GlcNAc:undecaprenyl-phosphate/decaprenyl-phosphate GlcNAc-1-phosphate transferase